MLNMFGRAVAGLLTQPFYYIAVLFIILQYTRQMTMERKLFAVKLRDWKPLALKALAAGLAVGIAVSAAGAFIGAAITVYAVVWLWSVALVLLLFRIRYLCFAYSAGIIALLQWAIGFTNWADRDGLTGSVLATLADIDAAGLLLLVALLHLAEAVLVRWQGDKLASPLFLEGKRGKLVGGYMLQGFWPVPLFLLVPLSGSAGEAAGYSAQPLPWGTLFGVDWAQGWTIAALPMVIGFTEMTRAQLPQQKAKHAAGGLLVYSVLLGGAALAAWWLPALLPLAGLLSIVLHEALVWRSVSAEAKLPPKFVHDARGLCILGIVPGTPADEMGLCAGEILHKVNGMAVRTRDELYTALVQNSAFCKLEAYNLEGELKFLQRARYAGEHHQLGVILAPDERADYYAERGPSSLLELLRRKRTANKRAVLNGGKDRESGADPNQLATTHSKSKDRNM